MLKYIGNLLAEEPLHWNFITLGNSVIANYQAKYESLSNFAEKWAKLSPVVEEKLATVINDQTLLPYFVGSEKETTYRKISSKKSFLWLQPMKAFPFTKSST